MIIIVDMKFKVGDILYHKESSEYHTYRITKMNKRGVWMRVTDPDNNFIGDFFYTTRCVREEFDILRSYTGMNIPFNFKTATYE